MNLLSRRAFLLGGSLALASYLVYEVNTINVVRYTIPVRNLPSAFHGFTILHLSDLHQKEFGDRQKRLLTIIGHQRFDMVAITGDVLIQQHPDVQPALDLIRGLPPVPIFFVNGNNEWGAAWQKKYWIMRRLGMAGAMVLANSAVPLPWGTEHLWIAGVDDPASRLDRLDLALAGTGDAAPVVLLAHSPSIFPKARQAGVALTLAGHTHGGQFRLPFIGEVWVPELGFFPKYDYGCYREGPSSLIVTGGLGESILPIRVNMPPEIVLVTLIPEQGAAS